MEENAGYTNAKHEARREKAAMERLEKKIARLEHRRRAPLEVCSVLSLNTDRIIRILDQYNIDKITLQEAKDWISIPEIAPEHAQKIFRKVDEVRYRNNKRKIAKKDRLAKDKANKEKLEALAKENIVEKLRKNVKRFSYEEERLLEDDLYYLAKGLAGSKPIDAVKFYIKSEYSQLLAKYAEIDFGDHRTYPAHFGDCDMDGKDDSCGDRIDKHKAAEKERHRLEAGMKEIAIMTGDIQKGDYVLFYFDSKIGLVKRVNKVSYSIEATGGKSDLGLMKNYRTNPEYAKKININDYPSYEVDDEVMVTCPDGHKRLSKIVEKRDSFYLVEYQIKSKKQNSYSWIDPMRFIEDKNKEDS